MDAASLTLFNPNLISETSERSSRLELPMVGASLYVLLQRDFSFETNTSLPLLQLGCGRTSVLTSLFPIPDGVGMICNDDLSGLFHTS